MFNNNIERWMEAADRSLAKSQQQQSSSSPDSDGQSTSDVVDGVSHEHDHNTQLNHSPSLSSSPSSGLDCDTTHNAPNKTSSSITTRTSVLIYTASKRVTRTMIYQDFELIIGHGDVYDDEPMINKSTVMKRLTIKDEKEADAILNDADDDDEEEEDADDDDNEIVKGLRNHHKVTYVRDVNPVKSGNGSTKSSSTSKLLASSKLSPFTSCMKKSNSSLTTSSAPKDASKR